MTLSGAITGRSTTSGRRMVLDEARRWPTKAFVVDLRWTLRLMSPAEWDEAADESAILSRELRAASSALVVTPRMLGAAERQCVRMAAWGVIWVPFLDLDDGLAWARSRLSRRESLPPPLLSPRPRREWLQ